MLVQRMLASKEPWDQEHPWLQPLHPAKEYIVSYPTAYVHVHYAISGLHGLTHPPFLACRSNLMLY